MSSNEFDFNLDSILEEFTDFSRHINEEHAHPEAESPAPAPVPTVEKAGEDMLSFFSVPEEAEAPAFPAEEPKRPSPAPAAEPVRPRREAAAPKLRPGEKSDDDPFYKLRVERRSAEPLKHRASAPQSSFPASRTSRPVYEKPPVEAVKEAAVAPKVPRKAPEIQPDRETKPVRPMEEAPAKPVRELSPLTALLGLIAVAVLALLLMWSAFNVHPGSGATAADSSSSQKLDMMSKFDVYLNNMASDAMGDLTYIRKVYKIDENATFGPAPNQNNYKTLTIEDSAMVLDVIQQARDSGLLGEQEEMVYNPEANFYHISDIQYYYDDTILVVCWKEQIDGKVCSFVEVKIADASQIRRKITEDTYGSSVKQYASQLSASANAVVAMNADFYTFRSLGMVVYQRQLYRFNDGNYNGYLKMYNALDHCFIDGKGDLILWHQGTEMSKEQMEQYLKDNDILFGLAFGPILIENGEIKDCWTYPAGEINTEYSRAGIAQTDPLHYLFMTVNWSDENTPRATVSEFAAILHSKGVDTAYCLDGGQTSEIVMNDIPFNRIDWNAERTVSDIIYFATAIPESEVTK